VEQRYSTSVAILRDERFQLTIAKPGFEKLVPPKLSKDCSGDSGMNVADVREAQPLQSQPVRLQLDGD
jgi:hypothetical protein